MADTLNSSWGALTLPIPAQPGLDLAGLDPARDILLDLFAAALTSELQGVFDRATMGTELRNVVGDKLPVFDDVETIRQRKCALPWLSVSRSVEPNQEDEFTLWQNRITSRWTIDYVLGPLGIGDQIKLGDVLVAAARVIAATIRNGGHKAYAATGAFAKQVLGPGAGLCGFSTIAVTSFITGAAAFAQAGPKYHAMTMTLTTTELDSIAGSAPAMTGAIVTIDGGPVVAVDTSIPFQRG